MVASQNIPPIHLLHLNDAYKLSFWIAHLPYYKCYSSVLVASISLNETYQVNESDLQIAENVAKMFYENSIAGYHIHKNCDLDKNDYYNLVACYKHVFNTKHEMVEYTWKMIEISQMFYKNQDTHTDTDNIDNIDNKQELYDKNWISDTYEKYCKCLLPNIQNNCKIIKIPKRKHLSINIAKQWINEDATATTIDLGPPHSVIITPSNSLIHLSDNLNVFNMNHVNAHVGAQQNTSLYLSKTSESEELFDLIAAVEAE